MNCDRARTANVAVARLARHVVVSVGVVAVSALAWAVAPLVGHVSAAVSLTAWAPVYTVSDLSKKLARDPDRWIGQTVRVRGEVVGLSAWLYQDPATVSSTTQSCCPQRLVVLQRRLVDPGAERAGRGLSLVYAPDDRWLAPFRKLPLVGALVPPAQRVSWGVARVYRVRLTTTAAATGRYQAVLLDADPRDE
jgi:hypothetical protein